MIRRFDRLRTVLSFHRFLVRRRRIIPVCLISLWLILATLVGSAATVNAEAKALTIGESLSLLQALRNLDGHPVIIKQNGADVSVSMPWEFGSGTLRIRLARNITALAAIEKSVEETRLKIIAEIVKGLPPGKDGQPQTSIPPGTPEFDNFIKQIGEMLNQPAQVTLSRIRAAELKLEKNEIPGTVLSALEPILDE